jgi:hypothetical protein
MTTKVGNFEFSIAFFPTKGINYYLSLSLASFPMKFALTDANSLQFVVTIANHFRQDCLILVKLPVQETCL